MNDDDFLNDSVACTTSTRPAVLHNFFSFLSASYYLNLYSINFYYYYIIIIYYYLYSFFFQQKIIYQVQLALAKPGYLTR